MINVLIVDDHQLSRLGLHYIFSNANDINIIGEASSGEEALEKARLLQPHIILMDIKMPGMGGQEATRRILAHYPHIKIIIVTMCAHTPIPKQLLDTGASGYLLKESGADEIITAVRTVHNGGYSIDSNVAQEIVISHLNVKGLDSSPVDLLSEREMQVMLLVSQGLTTKEIAESLSLCEKTINTYRYRLFDKLRVKCDVALARLAMQYELV